jgi:hypothetical protein
LNQIIKALYKNLQESGNEFIYMELDAKAKNREFIVGI